MISARLKKFLDENGVGYDVVQHDPAFTAQQLAAKMHIPGHEFVKVVVIKLDGRFALAALPAPRLVNFKELARSAGAKKCKLASEEEFKQLFPDCEVGAMSPFGNLYSLPTYVEEEVSRNENIVINAGGHADAIRVRYADFERLARPRVAVFAMPPPAEVAQQRRARAARRRPKKAKRRRKVRPRRKARARRKARPRRQARPKRRAKRKKPARRKKAARKKKKGSKKKRSKKRRRKRRR
ncbi:YbaK/EbsC family protein [Acidobacteriia bacterium AH_259_A11_L15]|nr:YbaK/EbsC family protein [Acidobacteriia bacterium AH_259_A11_L15]